MAHAAELGAVVVHSGHELTSTLPCCRSELVGYSPNFSFGRDRREIDDRVRVILLQEIIVRFEANLIAL